LFGLRGALPEVAVDKPAVRAVVEDNLVVVEVVEEVPAY
jgi:hypothetical protein